MDNKTEPPVQGLSGQTDHLAHGEGSQYGAYAESVQTPQKEKGQAGRNQEASKPILIRE